MAEVVFGPQVVAVVAAVYLSNVVIEAFERLSFAVLIEQRREGLVEFVEGLDAGEDVVGLLQARTHVVRHGHVFECAVQDGGVAADEFLHLGVGQYVYAQL